jgi:hypothetical protein
MNKLTYMNALTLFTISNTVTAEIIKLTVDKNGTVALG